MVDVIRGVSNFVVLFVIWSDQTQYSLPFRGPILLYWNASQILIKSIMTIDLIMCGRHLFYLVTFCTIIYILKFFIIVLLLCDAHFFFFLVS